MKLKIKHTMAKTKTAAASVSITTARMMDTVSILLVGIPSNGTPSA